MLLPAFTVMRVFGALRGDVHGGRVIAIEDSTSALGLNAIDCPLLRELKL